MLYIIGLGLGDVEDITVKGLKAVKSSDLVYLEHYTSILGGGAGYKNELEQFYGKQIILADRTMVEQKSDEIIDAAKEKTVSFLVVGDPFGATTHTDLVLRAIEKNINYKVIHNASIMNAIGCCGLQLYNYGEAISICFWSDAENWKPKSYFEKICENRIRGLHTLCLLDIKVKEKSLINIIKNKEIYEPPRYMSVSQACSQIIDIITEAVEYEPIEGDENQIELNIKKLVESNIIAEDTLAIGLARVGRDDQVLRVDTVKNLSESDLGEPLHSMIIAGKLHPLEVDFLKLFYNGDNFNNLVSQHNEFYHKK